ncbi:F/Y rich C-terminus-domain-containing protein [Sporodiniella umbellata]|nr:F/Y rich C-terminus-domain-containing protein [Sporodiniella umbellata]
MSSHASPQAFEETLFEETEELKSTQENEESFKKLKRKLKEMQELNAAIHKDYSCARKKIRTLTYERNLLLDSISRLDQAGSDESDTDVDSELSDSEEEFDVPLTKSKILKKLAHRNTSGVKENETVEATTAMAPPRRSKATLIPVKTRRVQPIDRDEEGQPKLPQQIGVLTVLKLGRIVTDRATFHNERYIFPVGYTVSRTYPSMLDPTSNTVITSTIVDGGDAPRFIVTAQDMPDEPIVANSATGAWTVVVRRSNEIRQREHSNSASGPDYYGFKHPTIAKLIQDLEGARTLKNYVWQNFEEMEPRAAKGVMAAAEKKRGNLEQMGNANRRAPKEAHHLDIVPTDEDFGEADELLSE